MIKQFLSNHLTKPNHPLPASSLAKATADAVAVLPRPRKRPREKTVTSFSLGLLGPGEKTLHLSPSALLGRGSTRRGRGWCSESLKGKRPLTSPRAPQGKKVICTVTVISPQPALAGRGRGGVLQSAHRQTIRHPQPPHLVFLHEGRGGMRLGGASPIEWQTTSPATPSRLRRTPPAKKEAEGGNRYTFLPRPSWAGGVPGGGGGAAASRIFKEKGSVPFTYPSLPLPLLIPLYHPWGVSPLNHPNPPLRGGAGVGCCSRHIAQPSVTRNHPTLCSSPKIGEE